MTLEDKIHFWLENIKTLDNELEASIELIPYNGTYDMEARDLLSDAMDDLWGVKQKLEKLKNKL